MAYSNYRSDWNRDRNERGRSRDRDQQSTQRDDDDERLARQSMERDYYGAEDNRRGGYGGGSSDYDEGSRYNRGYGQGDYDQDYGQGGGQGGRASPGGRFSESGYGRGREYLGGEGRSHYGNEQGGWGGREREQMRNRSAHGEYDREANYGGYSSSGTGNYRGYGGSGGSSRGGSGGEYGQGDLASRGYERARHSGQEQGYGQRGQSHGSGRPSGGQAYGDYSGSSSGYHPSNYGDEYSSRASGSTWGAGGFMGGSQEQDYGEHRGRGPRGYKRSDDRIREEVCDCLTEDDRLDATNIDVSVKDGEVTLSGTVTSRHDKRWAESLVERLSGVKEVQNSIRVQDQQRMQTGGTQTSGTQAGGTQAGGTASGSSSTTGSAGTSGKDKGKDSNIQH